MKTMQSKPNHNTLMAAFLAKGGQIKKCETAKPKPKRNEVEVVEIEIEHLPEALRRLVGE